MNKFSPYIPESIFKVTVYAVISGLKSYMSDSQRNTVYLCLSPKTRQNRHCCYSVKIEITWVNPVLIRGEFIFNDYQPNKQTNMKQYTNHNAFHARYKYKYLNLGLTVFEIKDDDIALQGNRYY